MPHSYAPVTTRSPCHPHPPAKAWSAPEKPHTPQWPGHEDPASPRPRHGVDQAFVGQHGRHMCGSQPGCSFPAEAEGQIDWRNLAPEYRQGRHKLHPLRPASSRTTISGSQAPGVSWPGGRFARREERSFALGLSLALARAGQTGAAATTWRVGLAETRRPEQSNCFSRCRCPVVLYTSNTGDFRKSFSLHISS